MALYYEEITDEGYSPSFGCRLPRPMMQRLDRMSQREPFAGNRTEVIRHLIASSPLYVDEVKSEAARRPVAGI